MKTNRKHTKVAVGEEAGFLVKINYSYAQEKYHFYVSNINNDDARKTLGIRYD